MKILIADDDRDLVIWLGYSFRRDGYTVLPAYNGEAALRVFRTETPDIVLLDLKMPKHTGLEVLQEIRRQSQVPVILLTATGDEETVVRALKSGADDYVTKPFRPRELRARAEAALRRDRSRADAPVRRTDILACGEMTLNPRTREVTISGQPMKVTPNELSVLEYLMLNEGTVVRIGDILANVWGYDTDQDEDVVRVTISRLRRKIEPEPAHPKYVLNVPGEGYLVRCPD